MDINQYSSLAISVCAVAFTAIQTHLQRRHNRLSVRPILQFDFDEELTDSGCHAKILLRNTGIGPAVVDEIEVTVDGRHVALDDRNDYMVLLRAKYPKNFQQIRLISFGRRTRGTAILPGSAALMAHTFAPGRFTEVPNFEEGAKTAMTARYSSIYGEKFTISTG